MKKLLFVLLAILPLCSFGIEPVIIELGTSGSSYNVPADKILIIEHLKTRGIVKTIYLDIIVGTTTNSLTFDVEDEGGGSGYAASLVRPIKVPLSARIVSKTTSYNITILGLLVDPTDLYARIETQSEGILCRNESFSFDVLAVSPRPGKIKLQGSTDLEEWHPIVDATIAKIDPSSHSISMPIAGNEKYYVKTLLTSVAQ